MDHTPMNQANRLRVICISLVINLCIGCSTNSTTAARTPKVYTPKTSDYQAIPREVKVSTVALTGPTAKDQLKLQAAQQLIAERKLPQAKEVLDTIDDHILPKNLSDNKKLVLANLALAENNPQASLRALSNIRLTDAFAVENRVDILSARAKAFQKLGYYTDAASTLIEKEALLSEQAALDGNHQAIWDLLNASNHEELQPKFGDDPVLAGWKSLVLINKQYADSPDAFDHALSSWLEFNPTHPAVRLFQQEQTEVVSMLGDYNYEQIALLLPLTGRYAAAGKAVENGILAAYYADTGPLKAKLRVYDTADETNVAQAYQQAIENGAQAIIGPLTKSGVEQLQSLRLANIPNISLNVTDYPSRPNQQFYQFGLLPEDEVVQVAKHAWNQGHMQAIIINPDSSWGHRLADKFRAEWTQLGGAVIDQTSYDTSKDLAAPVQKVLHIPDSKIRVNRLKRLIGQQVEFEARRRQDVDMIFLVAAPEQARQIKPLMAFYYAADIPLFSTSSVYNGYADPKRDNDVNGLTFCDAPWVLETDNTSKALQKTLAKLWPEDVKSYNRMYALGIDAYQILFQIKRMQRYHGIDYAGATGALHLSQDGRIERRLPCAVFSQGKPKLIQGTQVILQ